VCRQRWRAETLLTNDEGGQLGPWMLERAVRRARAVVDGLSAGFRFHDLRHYFASLLIASKADVKVVQDRLRHASAKTTLDTYGQTPTSPRARPSMRSFKIVRTLRGLVGRPDDCNAGQTG
jgi:integrase